MRTSNVSGFRSAAAREDLREQIAKRRAATSLFAGIQVRKVEAREIEPLISRLALTGSVATAWPSGRSTGRVPTLRDVVRIEPILIVDLALFLVAQDFVSLLDVLELLLGTLVARVHVRMVLPRQMPVSFANLLRLRFAVYA